jgi:kynurenine formamidase
MSGPSGWARFEPGDPRGALGFIDAETVLRAASLVRKGEVLPLNSPIDQTKVPVGRPTLRREARMQNFIRPAGGGRYVVINDDIVEFALQGSSHLDAFAHMGAIVPGEEGVYFGGAGIDDTMGGPFSKTLGIDAFGGAIVTRGVLIDVVATVLGEDKPYLADDFHITGDVISESLRRQNSTLERGDAVLVFTGYEDRLVASDGDTPAAVPGVDGTTLSIWDESEISLLASDNLAVEVFPVVEFSMHIGALRNLGIPLGELWALRELTSRCREDGVYEFLFVSVPLNIRGAFGSPANAVAIR